VSALAVVDFAWPRAGDAERQAQRAADRALARGARVLHARDAGVGRIYAPSNEDAADVDGIASELGAGAGQRLRAAILDVRVELAGAATGARCVAHYVVETDVDAAHEDDFNAWYDAEHLPGLAAVPGVIRAFRYRRVTGAPRYGAAYDLAAQSAFGSPAWLAVRATPWSSRVRPAFRNTTRTMYEVWPLAVTEVPAR